MNIIEIISKFFFFFRYQLFFIKNLSLLIKIFFFIISWNKLRVLYYTNNWVYTTNHKRIAVNYFWFVILSGIIGMVLATVVRLELAYPGVGIFAGDSLQYLSMVTAHGVIMVFFMIMPLLFGAFGNFLLPTQLGVHDVAFPRLNSAAFWFLPAGLIMLGQLVCLDRRYQRMNCFNIREVQSLLKRKFFTDLINTHDYKHLLNKTIIGTKYKTNDLNYINSNSFVFYNFGTEIIEKNKINNFNILNLLIDEKRSSLSSNSILFNIVNFFNVYSFFSIFVNFYLLVYNYFFTNYFILIKNLFFYIFSILNKILNFNNVIFYFQLFIYVIFIKPFYMIKNLINFLNNFIKNYFVFFYFQWLEYVHFISTFYNIKEKKKTNKVFKIWNSFFENISYTWKLEINLFFNSQENTYLYLINRFFFFFYKLLMWSYSISLKLSFSEVDSIKIQAENIFLSCQRLNERYNNFNVNNLNNFNYENIILCNKFYQNSYLFLNIKNKEFNFNDFFFKYNYNSISIFIFYFCFNFYYCFNYFFYLLKNIIQLNNILFLFNNFYNFIINWYLPIIFEIRIIKIFYIKHSVLIQFCKIEVNSFYLNTIQFFFICFNFIKNIIDIISFSFLYIYFNFSLFAISFWLFINIKDLISIHVVYFKMKIFNLNTISKTSNFKKIEISALKTEYLDDSILTNQFKTNYTETVSSNRNLKFFNPVFKYDYKSGDYFPKLYKDSYTHLFSTITNLTSGLKTAPWFYSNIFLENFVLNFNYFNDNNYNKNYNLNLITKSDFFFTNGFYNFFFNLLQQNEIINKRWISINSLNQKFYKMFLTSSMQQRIYSNWRQLKFTREAWRCKLLTARHQKTLYKRYVNEDGVFWSIERNAKDLLPGWAMITPFSSRTRFTAIGKVDIGLMGVLLVLNSSIVSGANFLVTYRYLSTLNNRKMRDTRSFFTEGVMVASWMMIAANPMLIIGIIMLLSDRHWQTSFFDYSGGGDTVLFQHMFWFFGHPEVYVIMIPVFGFTNTIISYYLKKRVSARASLLYSIYTIAFLGFFVWGHHMYMVGLAHTTRMLFSTLTVMISVPAATKLMHWCVTLANSAFSIELPFFFVLTFVFFFVSGGISGMCVAHTGMDILFHDTFYVIGHFHVMLAGGAMFGSFGAFYFYFPAIFGVKYSRIYGYLHYSYYLIGQFMTVIPMFWLGYAGMPRRVLDYPASMGGWHSVISAGHLLSVAGLICFFIMIFDSLRQSKSVIRNIFGINRYNTRLNFYFYEISKLIFVQQKYSYIYKYIQTNVLKLNKTNFNNYEYLETTLYSYIFIKK